MKKAILFFSLFFLSLISLSLTSFAFQNQYDEPDILNPYCYVGHTGGGLNFVSKEFFEKAFSVTSSEVVLKSNRSPIELTASDYNALYLDLTDATDQTFFFRNSFYTKTLEQSETEQALINEHKNILYKNISDKDLYALLSQDHTGRDINNLALAQLSAERTYYSDSTELKEEDLDFFKSLAYNQRLPFLTDLPEMADFLNSVQDTCGSDGFASFRKYEVEFYSIQVTATAGDRSFVLRGYDIVENSLVKAFSVGMSENTISDTGEVYYSFSGR